MALRNLLAAMVCSEEGKKPKHEGKQISNLHFSLQPYYLSKAKGQSLQQAVIKSRSFCLFNSLSEWFCSRPIYESVTQGQDATAAVVPATDSLFNLIQFFIGSSLSVYWPREYKVGIE